MRWHPHCESQMLFGNKVLRDKYLNYYSDISTYVEDSRHIEKCGVWLRRVLLLDRQDGLVPYKYMADVVMRRFVRDV